MKTIQRFFNPTESEGVGSAEFLLIIGGMLVVVAVAFGMAFIQYVETNGVPSWM